MPQQAKNVLAVPQNKQKLDLRRDLSPYWARKLSLPSCWTPLTPQKYLSTSQSPTKSRIVRTWNTVWLIEFAQLDTQSDEANEVPPVLKTYGTSGGERYTAEYHYAIWKTDRSAWMLLPKYPQFANARKTGRFAAHA